MTITHQATTDRTYEQAVAAMGNAARALYNAEVALHDAHQTHIDRWIAAAQDHLHSPSRSTQPPWRASRACAIGRSPRNRAPCKSIEPMTLKHPDNVSVAS